MFTFWCLFLFSISRLIRCGHVSFLMTYHFIHTYDKWTIKSHNRNEYMQICLFKRISAILQMAVYDPMKHLALVALVHLICSCDEYWLLNARCRYPWNEKDNVISIGMCGIYFHIKSHNSTALHLSSITNITELFWICIFKRHQRAINKEYLLDRNYKLNIIELSLNLIALEGLLETANICRGLHFSVRSLKMEIKVAKSSLSNCRL